MRLSRNPDTAWRRVVLAGGILFLSAVVPAKRRDPPRPPPYGVDKAAHALGHATFAAALFDAFEATDPPVGAPVAAVLLSTGVGVALELLQRWVPGRRYEHGDVLAGALGSAVAVVVAWGWPPAR
jgi:VanZ family protein